MIYDDLGVPRIINAYGTNTRLSGGLMAPEVLAAMAEAARATVEMHHLQAAASREISKATGAEAGIVTSGASAAVLLGAAACMARLDPGAMNRLPETRGMPDEFITIRSQRNMYDRALRVAGGRIIEIGIPDRVSGPGVRDAAPWEIADAITDRTAAIYYLAGAQSEPPLPDVVRVARERHIPVLVDAAAQLPPAENLKRFIAEGADLVCFSGGKALGGPQSSGILAGRRDLVASALAQMLDLDMPEADFIAPPEFAPLAQMRGLPHHGIGRSCKIGKEEIIGLIVALRRFVADNPAERSARWQARLEAVLAAAGYPANLRLVPDGAKPGLPILEWRLADAAAAHAADARLRAHRPAIHLDAGRIGQGLLAINPIAFDDGDAAILGAAIKGVLGVSDLFLVGNGAGFSGDRVDAPIPVMRSLIKRGLPAAMFFECLGERTVALAQLERRRDPEAGYEPMLERLLEPILADAARAGIPILGNFGAANPLAAARAIARLAKRLGLPELRIGLVTGDDVSTSINLDRMAVHEADTGLDMSSWRLVSANAYIGAAPLAEALAAGAQIVVAGRTSDPALAIAPLMHHFSWAEDDWQALAVGAATGHLLECGSQVTGGVFWDPGFKDIPDPANIGFPIAEVGRDLSLLITKPEDTGGIVDLRTVKEQLLYEVHDPARYITPDVTLDITAAHLSMSGKDRVAVHGLRGNPRPDLLKVTACYEGSWLGEGEISVAGPNALARAKATADVLLERVKRRGLARRARADLIGVASVHDSDDGALWRSYDGPAPQDIRIRLAVEATTRDDADQASREALALLCCGTAGTSGARWRVTPRILTRSFLVPRDQVPTETRVLPAREWN